MSLTPTPEELEGWSGVLERRFTAAAQTEDAYAEAARVAHRSACDWINMESKAFGSFRWVCDLLELEPDAVRRQVAKKRSEACA